MADKRTEETVSALKRALLELMGEKAVSEIGVSELVRRAGVGRSTFYEHFSGVRDVYEALKDDFNERTLLYGFKADEPAFPGGKDTYCRQLRDTGPFRALAHDPGYLPDAIRTLREMPERCSLMNRLVEGGVEGDVAWALQVFQLSGCYMASMEVGDDGEWERAKDAIDRFIRGGIAALTRGA